MLRKSLVMILLAALLALTSACLPVAATPLEPLPTDTSLPPTETPTPTIVWFPPTATFTPMATPVLTPTVDVAVQTGVLIFADNFHAGDDWELSSLPQGSAALGKDELTLAIQRPGGYLTSLRRSTSLGDFYAEVTASPSLCRGEDEYGLLFRYTEEQEFYRFSLNCQGQARVDKYYNGKASSPQPPVYSGAVPPGAPSVSHLGILAQGKELQFFSNGEHLFTVNDPSLPSGTLGFFARSNGETAVTVNFSDLKVYEAR